MELLIRDETSELSGCTVYFWQEVAGETERQRLSRATALAKMQAAIEAGRCWLLTWDNAYEEWAFGTEDDVSATIEDKDYDCDHDLIGPEYFAAFVRPYDIEPLKPEGTVDVGGVPWRAAQSYDGLPGLYIEHPELGWILVGPREHLPRCLAQVDSLPPVGRFIAGEKFWMKICSTAWDVATVTEALEVTEGVTPVHVETGGHRWTWWSDGVMTRTSHVVDECQSLEADAVKLIDLAWQEREEYVPPREPACGWATLARVAEIVAYEELAHGTVHQRNRQEAIHRFDVRMVDGERRSLWARSGPARAPKTLVYDFHTAPPETWRCNPRGFLMPLDP